MAVLTMEEFDAKGKIPGPAAVVLTCPWASGNTKPAESFTVQAGGVLTTSGNPTLAAVALDGAVLTVVTADGSSPSMADAGLVRRVLAGGVINAKLNSKTFQIGGLNLFSGGIYNVVEAPGSTATDPYLRGEDPKLRTIQPLAFESGDTLQVSGTWNLDGGSGPTEDLTLALVLAGVSVVD